MLPACQRNTEIFSSRLARRKKKEKNDWLRLIKALMQEKEIVWESTWEMVKYCAKPGNCLNVGHHILGAEAIRGDHRTMFSSWSTDQSVGGQVVWVACASPFSLCINIMKTSSYQLLVIEQEPECSQRPTEPAGLHGLDGKRTHPQLQKNRNQHWWRMT